MIHLNILPTSLKKENRLKIIFFSLKKFLYVIIILICLYATLLLILRFILELHYIKTVNENAQLSKTTETYTRHVKEINKEIVNIDSIQKNFTRWSQFIVYLSNNANSNIRFEELTINKAKNTLTIQGFAPTRNDLLSFKETLEKSTFLSEINFPIRNLLEKENIDFEITANFISYEFE